MKQIIIGLLATVAFFTVAWLVDDVLVTLSVQILLITLVSTAIVAAVILLLYFALAARERTLERKAARRIAEREADVHAIVSEHGIYVREMDPKATWRALHLNPSFYQNGRYSEPTRAEVEAYRLWTESRGRRPSAFAKGNPQPMLPEPVHQVDLMNALSNVQRCLIVGESDSGKTTLLQHIIAMFIRRFEIVVIDPHAYPGKWAGCSVFGRGRNYEEIDKALNVMVRLMTKRYEDIGEGRVIEGQHKRVIIIIDEWRAIVKNCGKEAGEAIGALLTESRKAAFSVFVATHSERVKALGIEGEGDLKDGFTIVRLSIVSGERTATIDSGKGEVPARLPGPYITQQQEPGAKIATREAIEILTLSQAEPEPDSQEQQILELHAAGASVSAIAQEVFGSKGGNQNQAVKDVLSKFERV